MAHTNPFAPDPANAYRTWSTQELETARTAWRMDDPRTHPVGEELNRREDVEKAVELWERLCAVPFVRGETQGYYTHSTAYLTPDVDDRSGNVHRMPDREELEALVLSDGEETAYPVHDACTDSGEVYWRQDQNPWSSDDRLYPVTLTLISCGDYHGSDVDAANNRVLDGTPGVTVRQPNTGGQGSVFNVSTVTVGEMTSFENATDPGATDREPAVRRADALMWLENLVTAMEGLTEYGLLDEQKHSEYLDELAEEAWTDHLESDTADALEDLSPETDWQWCDQADGTREKVHAAYFGCEENEWTAESATSVVNRRHKDAVKHVARTVFGWNVP